ncbi:MAG TPA: hypothetical protein PLE72_03140 [Azospira sp.]|nr:hypothetical protein [Azospira sp.]
MAAFGTGEGHVQQRFAEILDLRPEQFRLAGADTYHQWPIAAVGGVRQQPDRGDAIAAGTDQQATGLADQVMRIGGLGDKTGREVGQRKQARAGGFRETQRMSFGVGRYNFCYKRSLSTCAALRCCAAAGVARGITVESATFLKHLGHFRDAHPFFVSH